MEDEFLKNCAIIVVCNGAKLPYVSQVSVSFSKEESLGKCFIVQEFSETEKKIKTVELVRLLKDITIGYSPEGTRKVTFHCITQPGDKTKISIEEVNE